MAHIRGPASSNRALTKIVYIVDENHGESYRSIVPANAMRRNGIKANVVPMQKMHQCKASQWNVFVLRQIFAPVPQLQRVTDTIRQMGGKVIWDWDDNPHFHFGASRFDPQLIMALADANTVTTPRLAKVVPNSVVLPNAIDFHHWAYKPVDKPLTIGIAGGASHMQDWRQVKEPLKALMKVYDFRLLVVGYLPGYLRELEPEFIEWKHYREYPDSIRQMDIRLSPLDVSDEYNLFKSGIAALEAMAVGAVPVVSNHSVYRRVVNHRSNGLIVKEGWYDAIASLLEDDKLRTKLSATGRKWVQKHRNLDAWIPKWIQAYAEA